MKRVLVAVAAVSAFTLVALRARAQEGRQDELVSHHHVYESPQDFAIELRLSPYYPQVDSDPSLGGCTPFADIFGKSDSFMVGGEFDWQALRIPHLGTLGPGFGLSYTKMSGLAQFLTPHTLPSGGTTLTSGETTSLSLFPMYAVAVLRADVFVRELHTPFVPYAKFGLGYTIWRASNQLGTSDYNGKIGVGASIGTQLGLGLMFNLNVFDEYSAKNLDDQLGINHTYVFGEYTRADLDGLGIQSDPLRVGGQSWTFGLAFEF
jgi:hypothetical protein